MKAKERITPASTPTRNNADMVLAQAIARAGDAFRYV